MEASPSASLQGSDRIRSLTDQDSVFKAFDAYPWTKDTAFLSGLHAILGEPNSPNPQPGSPRDIATHARIFYYAQRIGVTIEFGAYQSWLSEHPEHQAPDILPPGYEPSSSEPGSGEGAQPSATAWQQAAPKADLYVDKSANPQPGLAAASSSGGDEPSYPMAFAEMIKLIQEGKPIPGIRQIPNTLERDPTVRPVGSKTVPRKPWERHLPTASTDVEGPKTLDLEFPPVDPEQSSTTV